jgi:hypothetical protein
VVAVTSEMWSFPLTARFPSGRNNNQSAPLVFAIPLAGPRLKVVPLKLKVSDQTLPVNLPMVSGLNSGAVD